MADIYLDASRLGIYPPLFTSPSGNSCIVLNKIKENTNVVSIFNKRERVETTKIRGKERKTQWNEIQFNCRREGKLSKISMKLQTVAEKAENTYSKLKYRKG